MRFTECLFVVKETSTVEKQCRNKNVTFVSPAIGATLQTFLARSELMIELLPTLG